MEMNGFSKPLAFLVVTRRAAGLCYAGASSGACPVCTRDPDFEQIVELMRSARDVLDDIEWYALLQKKGACFGAGRVTRVDPVRVRSLYTLIITVSPAHINERKILPYDTGDQ